MLEMITPITDRTASDVNLVNEYFNRGWSKLSSVEKQTWLAGMKGALNKSDLLRIENNIQLLSDVLELDLNTYVGNIPALPKASYYENLLSNVEAIKTAFVYYDTTPATPSTVNKYTDINDIEQILFDVYKILTSNFYNYCGELYAGEILGL